MLLENFTVFLVFVAFMGFASKRLLTYLHAFQQEEYDNSRFLNWVFANRVFDRRLSAGLIVICILWIFAGEFRFFINTIILIGFTAIAYTEKDPRKDSKKKLAMTDRAKRIYIAALICSALSCAPVLILDIPFIWLVLVQAIPVMLVLGNLSLKPYEDRVQRKFWKDAHEKLTRLSPTVIGVTGSFGKTSVKHILAHILQSAAPTLATPGSVNTPMGIARIIREQLDETHRFFIVEMGAYGPGSIDRLCKLAPPDHGIISAIGHAHYERFKTLEAVAETKFELAQAAMGKGGRVIVQEKTLRFPYTDAMKSNNLDHFIIVGNLPTHGLFIEKAEQKMSGLEMRIRWDNATYVLDVPLFGLHHADNVALAFAAACKMGMNPKDVVTVLKSTPQIPHRLEVKPMPGKGIIIDDAYNSNPLGFRSALDLLYQLGHKKRKILITPGMVELGGAHDEIHRQIGLHAAQRCDIAIVVKPERIASFISGFKEEARADQAVIEVDTFAEAQKWANDNMNGTDVVLIENDLPDLYERVPRL
jgi:UDP-N-acetylmuramoyl-tripeptide--D-alanyl-D-alanine ligase